MPPNCQANLGPDEEGIGARLSAEDRKGMSTSGKSRPRRTVRYVYNECDE
jgi:hypothetical protein